MNSLRAAILPLVCLIVWLFVAPPVCAASDNLGRYVGNYLFAPNRTLHVVQDGDNLTAQAPGLPPGTLDAQSETGWFALREAPFEFRFQENALGGITGLEITDPAGKKRFLPRVVDTRIAAEPLRAIPLDAETSLNAQVFNGYERIKGADGKFRTETYTFGEGGFQPSSPTNDSSIDNLSFKQIAYKIAPALRQQGYIASNDIRKTDLLIMVYWGSTEGKDHPAVVAEESYDPTSHVFRNQINRLNSRLLGFQDAVKAAPAGFHSSRAEDLVSDLEESRYWVALVALDFDSAWKQKKITPLWSVRYNLPSQGTDFTAALPQMTQFASHYFGRDSKGLINRSTTENLGRVDLGELQVVGYEESGK